MVRDYTYDVYGQVTGGSGSTPNEFDFAGQQSDDSTGLQYLRARYYDPATGVFISRDPLAAGPSWLGQPFGYASANPATRIDPTGLYDDPSTDCDLDPDGASCVFRVPGGPVAPGESFDAIDSIINNIQDRLAMMLIHFVFLSMSSLHYQLKDCALAEYCREAVDSILDFRKVSAADITAALRALPGSLGLRLAALGGTLASQIWWAYKRWADAPPGSRLRRDVAKMENISLLNPYD